MSAETTSTSLVELVNSEFIEPTILAYAADQLVIAPHCRVSNLAGKATKTASFPAWEKDTGADLTEGASDFSNTELQTTEVAQISAAMVGISREVTDLAFETNIMGPAALLQFILEDGAYLCQEMLEDDLAALFASASTSVGQTGTDMSVANFVEAKAKLLTNRARGNIVCILDDQQHLDLTTAVAASGAGVFANAAAGAQTILSAGTNASVGSLFNVPIFMTNLTDTANTAADVVGVMMIDGATSPAYAPIGVALLAQPRLKTEPDARTVSDVYTIWMAYGVGEVADLNYVKIVTDA